MVKLYGIALSNYTNMARSALIEKGIDYEFIITPPGKKDPALQRSPMGKIPVLEVDGGMISETSAILDYLEDVKPEPALLPADPLKRARARELSQAFELYVELVARKGIGALFGVDIPDHIKKGMSRDLPAGLTAVGQLTKFSPWVAGDEFTYADLVGYYTMTLANMLAEMNCDMNLFELLPGSAEWYARVGERESVKFTDSEMAIARKAMLG